jgi:hypothetical protein
MTSQKTTDTDELFYWRYATIHEGVKYPTPQYSPLTKIDGLIHSWESSKFGGLYPFSFPKHVSAIFRSNSTGSGYSQLNVVHDYKNYDKFGFRWGITEQEARDFLMKSYPEIYKSKLIEKFKWRNATIAPGIQYLNEKACPLDIYNGLIDSWGPVNGLWPFSYPKNASPVFKACSLRSKRTDKSESDQYGFVWDITEEEARDFLKLFYPSIYGKIENNEQIANPEQIFIEAEKVSKSEDDMSVKPENHGDMSDDEFINRLVMLFEEFSNTLDDIRFFPTEPINPDEEKNTSYA